MVSFGQNLNTWKSVKNINIKSLAKKSGITEGRINDILNDRVVPTADEIAKLSMVFQVSVVTFTRGVKIDEEAPVIVNKGSVASPMNAYDMAFSEYLDFPKLYQKKISHLFTRWLEKHLKKSGVQIERITKCGDTVFSAYRNEKYSMSENVFYKIGSGLVDAGMITEKEYFEKFKYFCDSYVGNYNLLVARELYLIPLVNLSVAAGKTPATCGQLVRFDYAVTEASAESIAPIFGIEPEVFRTILLKENDFTKSREEIVALVKSKVSVNSPDEPIIDTRNNFENVHESDSVDEVSAEMATEEEVNDVPVVEPETVAPVIPVTQSKVQKMYARLSDEHRTEIDALIEKYFWEDL